MPGRLEGFTIWHPVSGETRPPLPRRRILLLERSGLLHRDRYACALFEHRTELNAIAAQLDAHSEKKP